MAKNFLYMMVAAAGMLAVSSCSQDELVTETNLPDGNEITFAADVNRATRNAGDVTTDNLNEFYVTAFLRDPDYNPANEAASPDANNYFTWEPDPNDEYERPIPGQGNCLFYNEEFVRQGNTGTFKINRNDPYHWPGSGQYVTFFAFSPSLKEINMKARGKEVGTFVASFPPEEDQPDPRLSLQYIEISDTTSKQVDLIVSDPITDHRAPGEYGIKAHNTTFNFKHLLSQVEIKVKTTQGSLVDNSYTVSVAGVCLGSCILKGDYSLTGNKWTGKREAGTRVWYYFGKNDKVVTVGYEPQSVMGLGGNAMTIPQTAEAWDMSSNNSNNGLYVGLLLRVVHKDGRCVFPYADKYMVDDTTPTSISYIDKYAYHVGPDGNKYQWAAIPFSATWEAGKKYVYTLDLSNGVGYNDPSDEKTGTGGELILNGEVTIMEQVEAWTAGTPGTVNFEIIEPEDDNNPTEPEAE